MRPAPLLLLAALAACRSAGPAPVPDGPLTVARLQDGVAVGTAAGHLRLTFPAPDVVRVRAAPSPAFPPDRPWAVDPAALRAAVPFAVEETEDAVRVRTAALEVRLTRRPLRLSLLDAQGRLITEQAAPIPWTRPGAEVSFSMAPGARAYGLGDKVKGYDRSGQAFQLWNHDAYGWGPGTDPLYKSIPFLIFVHEGRAHGLFVDDPSGATVDVGRADAGRVTYRADRGALDLYLFAGPDPRRVLEAYTALTGRTPLPPRWALGYHQSRYGYETEAEVREVARRLRAERVPADAVWLDIDYQLAGAPFTVDARRFPTFAAMVADLKATGMRAVVITDPHLARVPGYAPYDSALAGDHLVRTAAGEPFVGPVWPGPSVFPEFTLARTRAWWGGLYRPFVEQGVAGFWNDMNEPALLDLRTKTMPEETPHRLDDGTVVDHELVHNAYGTLNARATYEGVLALRPDARPFVLTRSAYAGAQRWAASWTGDNSATREHLALTLPTLLNLGASGYAFVGADVGGFAGCPGPELLTRWMELGALQPFFRNHSDKTACRREPWVDGPGHLARRRAAVERRYRLLPYLYTAFEETSRTGLPVMRPLWLHYPSDPGAATDRAYLLGRDLLVAPRLEGGDGPYRVALPAGDAWWDVRTGRRLAGGDEVTVAPPPAEGVQLFARAGAVIPEQPVVQHAGERPAGPLTLHVWPGAACEGALYLDDGEGFGFTRGELRRVRYACATSAEAAAVTATSTGAYPAWWTATRIVVHGVPRPPRAVGGAGRAALPFTYDAGRQEAVVTLEGDASDWAIDVRW